MFIFAIKKQITSVLLLIALCFAACGSKEVEEIPEGVLPREQMIDIVVDAWYMESVIHNSFKEYDRLEAASMTYYAQFFEEHDISKEQFTRSIEYYMRDDNISQRFIADCSKRFDERREEFTGEAVQASLPQ